MRKLVFVIIGIMAIFNLIPALAAKNSPEEEKTMPLVKHEVNAVFSHSNLDR